MIRAEARAALAARIGPAVEALGAVFYRWPVAATAPVRVVLAVRPLDGTATVPTFEGANPLRSTDEWDLEVHCAAEADLQSTAAAEQLVQDLAQAAAQAVHNDASLGGLTKSAGAVGSWRLTSAVVVRRQGPEVADFDTGPEAYCIVTVRLSAQIFH